MSDSNRLRVTVVKETTLGTTPTTPRMRTMRVTGETLRFEPQFVNSAEIRDDRMNADPIKTTEDNTGPINFEVSFPVDESPLSELLASAFYNTWTNTPYRDNDGSAGSVISDISSGVFTVTTGDAFTANHLVYISGLDDAENNGLFECTTGSATVPAFVGQSIVDDASPSADARMKVCGFYGATGDITALSDGLGSTTLDYTTLGLQDGQWIKIGGAATANKFATADNNDWARVTDIAANKLTLDNLPADWSTDTGTGKDIYVFFGDVLKNGTTRGSLTVERGFMDQSTPTYVIQRGMVVGQLDLDYTSGSVITGTATLSGLSGEQTTTSLDASPDAATTNQVMASNDSVSRVSQNGATIASPNYVTSLKVSINNNVRMQGAVGTVGSVDIGTGMCAVTGTIETYFGDNTLYASLLSGTAANASVINVKNNQAVITTLPRYTYTSGAPNAAGQNQDVMLSMDFSASYDTTTASHIQMDRLEYFEE